MRKAIALVLIALGAQVSAEDNVADMLGERASPTMLFVGDADLDDVLLAKGKKEVAAVKPKASFFGGKSGKSGKSGKVWDSNDKNTRGDDGKRVFGGTNTLMAGNGQAIQGKPKIPDYWNNAVRQANLKRDIKPIAKKPEQQKNVFGGTNKKMAGEGMAIQGKPKIPKYWGR